MNRAGRTAALAGLTAGLALALAGAARAGVAPEPLRAAPPSLRPGRRDVAFAAAAAGAAALVATRDRRWSAEAAGNPTRGAHDLAAGTKRLGDPLTVGGALLGADLVARAAHAGPAAAGLERIAVACGAAGALTLALKRAIGRERPDETSDPERFRPFSGHDALPSGHATLAFALAGSLDAETRSRWVPALAYPAAALTAWSRVHDRHHWPSDVVAGAAIGAGVAWRADAYARARWPRGLVVLPASAGRGAGVAVFARF